MLALAIHTSSPELGLALSNGADVQRHRVWPLGRDLSAHLHTCLDEFIQPYGWSDFTWLAIAIGPGGFTGTRIGVVTARTLAQQLQIPLFGISSLATMAATVPDHPPAIAVQMQAQRGELFGGIYGWQGDQLITHLPDQVFSPDQWQHTLDQWSQPCKRLELTGGLAHSVPQVLILAQQQWQAGERSHWQTVVPLYGQHPVREEVRGEE